MRRSSKIEEDAFWDPLMTAQWDSKTVFWTGHVPGDGDQVHCTRSTGRIYIEVVGEGMGAGLDAIGVAVEGHGECPDVLVAVVTMAGVLSHSFPYKVKVSD